MACCDEGGKVGRRRGRQRLVSELKRALIGIAESGGKVGKRSFQIILRLYQQELRLRQVYVSKTDVEAGLQFVFFQRGDLIGNELAILDGFLRDLQHSLAFNTP